MFDTDAARALAASFPSRITTHKFCSQAKKTLTAMADEIDQLHNEIDEMRGELAGGTLNAAADKIEGVTS